ncbi:hypothetical protein BDF22DRAFT_664195 [Syncephalis plumigaleata]|nr:hypothetical protein BDF22DRAFT_664195 [Syncephalis plumigaleata]
MTVALYDFEEDFFTPACESALTEIFKRFDKDNDGALSLEELNAFAEATNGEAFTEETLDEIKESFDVNDQNDLTLRGFLEMYTLQTTSEPEETWKDLRKLGYNEQLTLIDTEDTTDTV